MEVFLMGMYNKVLLTRDQTDLDCSVGGPSMTKQSFADETDINKIVARFEKTGLIEHLNSREPFYGDVSDIVGYQEALNVVQKADDLFNAYPAKVRERFDNDPVKFIEFISDRS